MGSASSHSKRYVVTFTYRYEDGLLDVVHEAPDISYVQQLLDNGPDETALEKITITQVSEKKSVIRG